MKGDRDILKADLDDGYAKVANLLLEALAMAKMSGVQKGICLFLVRRTYSWGQKEDRISLKEFAEACDSSPTYVSKQLKKLIDDNVIIRTENNVGKVPAYAINTRVVLWDKGCLNRQGLSERIRQGLFVCSSQGLSKQTRVDAQSGLEPQDFQGSPKERFKESIKDDDDNARARERTNWLIRYKELFPFDMNSSVPDLFQPFANEMGDDVVIEALNRARTAEFPKRYAEKILWDWQERGVKSLSDIERLDKLRDRGGGKTNDYKIRGDPGKSKGKYANLIPTYTDG